MLVASPLTAVGASRRLCTLMQIARPTCTDSPGIELTREELALLRASVTFQARWVTDPALRARLEGTALKLSRLATVLQAG
jgi:hypothetical protein